MISINSSSQDSLDNINEQANEGYSKVFFKFFEEKLGTPGNRGYITFIDPGRAYIGYVFIISFQPARNVKSIIDTNPPPLLLSSVGSKQSLYGRI
jgi:hypothetical protein